MYSAANENYRKNHRNNNNAPSKLLHPKELENGTLGARVFFRSKAAIVSGEAAIEILRSLATKKSPLAPRV